MNYLIEHPEKLVKGNINLPASKSLSNRALIIQSLCKESFYISNLSEAKDTKVLEEALKSTTSEINIGDAGTSMRFLTALLGSKNQEVIISGSNRMHERPIAALVEALNTLGANISYLEKEGYPPLHIQKGNIQGGEITIDSGISSQFISALLLIAPTLKRGLTIKLKGELVSKSYLEMTLKMMAYFGIKYSWNSQTIQIKEQQYQSKDISIESDWSAASFWLEIVSLAKDANVNLIGLKKSSWQGDSASLDIFSKLAVDYHFEGNKLHLQKSENKHFTNDFDLVETPDLAQPICCTFAGLKRPLTLKGLSTLKVKETDRIIALQSELKKMGVNINIIQETIQINSFKNTSAIASIRTHQDHRMAMSFAPLSLIHDKVIIEDISVVEKSYPNYWEDLKKVGFKIKPLVHSNS